MLNVTPESHRRSDSPQPNREDLDCVVEVHNLTLAPAPSKVAPAESIEPLQHLSRRIARLQRGAEEPDPDIAGRIAPVPPVAENLWRLRNAIDQFVTESLRAPSKFGFAAEPVEEVDATVLKKELEEAAIRLMLMSEAAEDSPMDPSSIYQQAAEAGAHVLNEFLPELRAASQSGMVSEAHQEALFLALVDLKSNLTQLNLNIRAQELQELLEMESSAVPALKPTGTSGPVPVQALPQTLESRTRSRSQILLGDLPVEKVMKILTKEMTAFLSEHSSRARGKIGFNQPQTDEPPVRMATLLTLLEESKEFAEKLANEVGEKTGIDLTLQTMAHNLATVCDLLIIPFVRHNHAFGVAEKDVPSVLHMVSNARSQFIEYRKQLRDYRQMLVQQGVL
ncbi:MAG: hypothetical protein KDD64_13780 [Bdellovibrionales bacterium]|nr:hypothetical protein [Bdellovibrionales bacterium]